MPHQHNHQGKSIDITTAVRENGAHSLSVLSILDFILKHGLILTFILQNLTIVCT